jgi:hypothetical protein
MHNVTWLDALGQVDVEETFWGKSFEKTAGTAYLDPEIKKSFQYTTGRHDAPF